jgi:hypothetical protein
LAVLPADVQDWDGAEEVIRRTGRLPRLARVWADAGYKAFAAWVAGHCRWVLEVVSKRPGQTTFEVQKWRWIVERTFGWFGRYHPPRSALIPRSRAVLNFPPLSDVSSSDRKPFAALADWRVQPIGLDDACGTQYAGRLV